MNISVIIPVYNAELFVEKAIYSALAFEEVKEVVIVEDASPDKCLLICQEIAKKDLRVKVYQHPDKKNHGAGASMDYGFKLATQDYLCILGADDLLLPNRFDAEKEIFKKHTDAEGVYGGMGVHFYSEKGKELFYQTFSSDLTTVFGEYDNNKAFYGLLGIYQAWKGYFSLNAFTIKRNSLTKMNYWINHELRLHQDTEFILRFAYYNKIYPGITEEPIALRGVHDSNRITSSASGYSSNKLLYENILEWYQKQDVIEDKVMNKIKGEIKILTFLDQRKKLNLFSILNFILCDKTLCYNERYFKMALNETKFSPKSIKTFMRIKEKIIITFFAKKKKNASFFVHD